MVPALAGSSQPTLLKGGSTVTVINRLLQLNSRMLTGRKQMKEPIMRVKICRHHHRFQIMVNRIGVGKTIPPNRLPDLSPAHGTNLKLRPALSPSLTVTTNPHCPVSTCSKSVPVTTRRKRHSIAPCSAERKRSDAGLNYSINIEIQKSTMESCYRYRSPRRPPQHNCQERPPPV